MVGAVPPESVVRAPQRLTGALTPARVKLEVAVTEEGGVLVVAGENVKESGILSIVREKFSVDTPLEKVPVMVEPWGESPQTPEEAVYTQRVRMVSVSATVVGPCPKVPLPFTSNSMHPVDVADVLLAASP